MLTIIRIYTKKSCVLNVTRFLTIAAFLISTSANASITEAGRGMLFGRDHTFAVTAMTGWVLDNKSGVGQGLHMVFYPKGETWSNSPVIIYGRAVSTKDAASPKQLVEQTVNDFKSNGSPSYSSLVQSQITLHKGQKAELYYFAGDQWGNYEAAAYFQEVDTINALVFNSRTKTDFYEYIGDFLNIVITYQNLYTPSNALTNEQFNSLKRESKSLLSTQHGKDYESKAVQVVGQTMANAMHECASYMQGKEFPEFNYFVRIDKGGNINNATIFPISALSACFRGLMSSAIYPTHNFDSFVLNIEVKVTP